MQRQADRREKRQLQKYGQVTQPSHPIKDKRLHRAFGVLDSSCSQCLMAAGRWQGRLCQSLRISQEAKKTTVKSQAHRVVPFSGVGG